MDAANLPFQQFLAPIEMVDPGTGKTIYVERSACLVPLTSVGAETRTVANPTRPGAFLTLAMKVDSGDITVTFSTAYDEAGTTTFVFSDPGQFIFLQSVRISTTAIAWRKIADHNIANLTLAQSAMLAGITATAAEINARAAAASRRVAVTDAATYIVLAANSGKTHVFPDLTQNCTLALPAAAEGLEYTFISKAIAADASNWIFQVAESGISFLGGLGFCDVDTDVIGTVFPNGSSNDFMNIVTPSAGTVIYLICDGTNWIVSGRVFSNTTPTFSDT